MESTIYIKAVDENTGEIREFRAKEIKDKRGGRYMTYEQQGMIFIAEKQLRGKTSDVMHYLMGVSDFTNRLPAMVKVSRGMKRPSSHIARAYKELLGYTILVRDEDGYMLNPRIFWKGTAKQRKDTIERLEKEGVKL